jgi:hypothetical protein
VAIEAQAADSETGLAEAIEETCSANAVVAVVRDEPARRRVEWVGVVSAWR